MGGGGVTADRQGGGVLNKGSYRDGSCGRSTSYQLYIPSFYLREIRI